MRNALFVLSVSVFSIVLVAGSAMGHGYWGYYHAYTYPCGACWAPSCCSCCAPVACCDPCCCYEVSYTSCGPAVQVTDGATAPTRPPAAQPEPALPPDREPQPPVEPYSAEQAAGERPASRWPSPPQRLKVAEPRATQELAAPAAERPQPMPQLPEEPTPSANDLFGAPTEEPADDLFAAPADEPAEDMFAAPAEEPTDDMFAAPADDSADDLFGPPTEEQPVEVAPSAADDRYAPPADAPAETETDDLFGPPLESMPLEEPAEELAFDDLFGAPVEETTMPAEETTMEEEADEPIDDEDDLFGGFGAILHRPGGMASEQLRRWVDDTGRYSCEGRLVRLLDGKVQLLKANGRTATVPLTRLSSRDLEFVHRQTSAHRAMAVGSNGDALAAIPGPEIAP